MQLLSFGGEEEPEETWIVISDYAGAVHSYLTLPFDHMLVSMMMMIRDTCTEEDKNRKLQKSKRSYCTGRESNPGLPRGRREFYH